MTTTLIPAQQYRDIFVAGQPLIDLRAPIEFNRGAFPSSVNLPLMVDKEREKVGTCYKQQGQQAAIALGHSLVHGAVKQQRIDAWLGFLAAQPEAYLYCFRGGLRSQLTQQWLKEAGAAVPYVQGGYKGMRQYLIGVIETAPSQQPLLSLSGMTGSGKTDFLIQRKEAVDLEGIANHRGSSFGKNIDPQPTQINFENQLAIALLRHQQGNHSCLLLEDESFLIGRSALPQSFYNAMQTADILVLEEADDIRLNRLLDEYVHKMHQGFVERLGIEAGFDAFSQYLLQSLTSIRKRLGGKQYQELQDIMQQALSQQLNQNQTSQHLAWISLLLQKYYDPMYEYQLAKKAQRVLFRGNHQAMHEWLDTYQRNNDPLDSHLSKR
ncbi:MULTISPECIES: tRNA 2-selenouridine(34) synthase MnmH [Shewanella]|uniref:tRNA 2-selenouridine synthase n=1 Tax=Shewanella cutis TaxID=2766780 RepID=A0ABS9QZM5_9GAMM|nr:MULTISPECIES: tRNA 2-selenouridine(34) synthase MnmH [Shewanella]MCG9965811.1 tRNA 2-selenouridine(34) synthase MnmH [Shewanella sp. PS-2]MDI5877983.1 tRNA 2-selenouridine(34) synthase MnmH [Shewanella xiamenensis]